MAIVAEGLMSDSEARTTRSVGGARLTPLEFLLGQLSLPQPNQQSPAGGRVGDRSQGPIGGLMGSGAFLTTPH